ncbi:heme lyase NrfEFG subunit NrfF [Shewanella sp. A3A]|uniref:Formate-dependent nitrite reductase complex subunit n=2 Tax=Shewanella electrica TaxID=515560 RepID=A0ABT2FMY8_9GAMM|nr:heme lyase NrfEFG subunit NrfF [Shewanella electrica]MCH1919478.1 heme lyase NrfEFG subunit NrfF [Shewanella ferrihydritica]MCH1926335.1 heme lyase NrfEFG subunit NrfF [Shewanella electrica]MCS4557698.1 heme lyase NrfEFG subunit NrfF [Shewanella electrica]
MKSRLMTLLMSVALVFGVSLLANATPVDTYQFKNEANQKHAMELARSLRCPQCQNQDIVDSNSPVAKDLRMEVYQMVDAGKSDKEIIAFMTSRYGDFVLYKPRLDSKTYILWLGPVLLLLFGGLIAFIFIRRQRTSVAAEEISAEDQQKLAELLKRQ